MEYILISVKWYLVGWFVMNIFRLPYIYHSCILYHKALAPLVDDNNSLIVKHPKIYILFATWVSFILSFLHITCVYQYGLKNFYRKVDEKDCQESARELHENIKRKKENR